MKVNLSQNRRELLKELSLKASLIALFDELANEKRKLNALLRETGELVPARVMSGQRNATA